MRTMSSKTFACIVFCLFAIVFEASAQGTEEDFALADATRDNFAVAEVTDVITGEEEHIADTMRSIQYVTLRFLSGPKTGEELELENYILNGREDMHVREGERVVVETLITYAGNTQYFIREKYRLPALLWLCGGFFFLAFLLGGKKGLTSVFGLMVSILILVLYVVPGIVNGGNP